MKIVTIILACLLIASSLYSQDLLVAHEMTIHKMTVDNENRLILGGSFTGTLDVDFSPKVVEIHSGNDGNRSDMFIASYDSLKNLNWYFTLGQGSEQNFYNILTDDSCNIYISGFAYADTDFDPSENVVTLNPDANGNFPFLVKYNKEGKLKWVKNNSINIHTLLHHSIYGYNNEGYNNDRFKKYDLNGQEIWNVRVPNHSNVVFDNKSKFYFSIDTIRNEYRGHPLTIYAIDTLGHIDKMNLSQAGVFYKEALYLVNNKIVIKGSYWGHPDFNSGNTVLNNTSMYDIYQHGRYVMTVISYNRFMAVYDLDGHFVSATDQYPSTDKYSSDPSGNIYTMGLIKGSANLSYKNQENTISSIAYAYYLAKYDSDFNFISAVKLWEGDNPYLMFPPTVSMMYFHNNYTILNGRFNNVALRQDASIYPNDPVSYICVYKNFDILLSTTTNTELSDSRISIYPNPVADQLTIDLSRQKGETTLSIYQLNGQEIIHRQLVNNKTVLDMKAYNKGIYLIKLSNNKTQISRKIVKQ